MNLEQILKAIEILQTLITIFGDEKMSDAKTWLEVKANAERLRLEGHEPIPETPPEEPTEPETPE